MGFSQVADLNRHGTTFITPVVYFDVEKGYTCRFTSTSIGTRQNCCTSKGNPNKL
jgi:hypothetical protein